jgi:hypothetical protein
MLFLATEIHMLFLGNGIEHAPPWQRESDGRYTAKYNLTIGGFEVGNEKEHVLTPQDYATCMQTMRTHINRIWPDAALRPLLIGPVRVTTLVIINFLWVVRQLSVRKHYTCVHSVPA